MLQEAFERIMDEFPTIKAKRETFSGHPLAKYIRVEIPHYLSNAFDNANLLWKGSPGKGKWVDAPWIASLNILVTESPQEGFYLVYLFNQSMTSVYLSFHQGMTKLQNEFKTKLAKEILLDRGKVLRNRLPESKQKFDFTPISLEPSAPDDRLAMYEASHVFGKRYDKGDIPKTAELLQDLTDMLTLYDLAIQRGVFDDFFSSLSTSEGTVNEEKDQLFEEARSYHLHRRIERNRKLAQEAKKYHGYICEICRFDFEKTYGMIGREFIEAHHIIPLSALEENVKVVVNPRTDFAVLCSNCHSMVHRRAASASYEDFKQQFEYLGE